MEIAKQQHAIFLDAMETRYKEILTFVGFMLPALGGFILLLQRFETGGRTSEDSLLLFVGTLASLFLLTWGAMYALATSYRYRYLQASCYKIEEHSGASQWIPTSFKPQKSTLKKRLLLSIAPGILQVHLIVFLFAIAVIGGAFFALIRPVPPAQASPVEIPQAARLTISASSSVASDNGGSSIMPTPSGRQGAPTTPSRNSLVTPIAGIDCTPSQLVSPSTTPIVGTSMKGKPNTPNPTYPIAILIASGLCLGLVYFLGTVHYPNKMDNIINNLDRDKPKSRLALITGPSGSGKSTLIAYYCQRRNAAVPMPVTTRPERTHDARRVKYLSPEEFHRLETQGRLRLVAQNYGHRYGYYCEDLEGDNMMLVEVDSVTAISQRRNGHPLVIRVLPARADAVVLTREQYGQTLEAREADLAQQIQPEFLLERQKAEEYLFINRFNQKSCEEFVDLVDRLLT